MRALREWARHALRGVSALGEDDDPRTIELLTKFLSYPDPEVIGRALDRVGDKANAMLIEALIPLLGDRREWHDFDFHGGGFPVHDGAFRALKKIGEPAVERLVAALKAHEPLVRANAARLLGEIGDRRAIDGLITLIEDPDKHVIRSAVEALSRMPDSRAIGALVNTLTGPGRNSAATALGALRAVGAVPQIRAAWLALLLRHEVARKALSDIGTTEAQSVLHECEARMSITLPSGEERSWVPRVEDDKIVELDTQRLQLYLLICEDYLRHDNGRYEHEIRRRLTIGGAELYRRELADYSQRQQTVE